MAGLVGNIVWAEANAGATAGLFYSALQSRKAVPPRERLPALRRPRFESPQLHQEVCASRHDFLHYRIAGRFRGGPAVWPRSVWATLPILLRPLIRPTAAHVLWCE
jgi:hypothetical protein